MIYVYENSFEGYLSAVFEIYLQKDFGAMLENAGEGVGGLDNICLVQPSVERARRVTKGLEALSTLLPGTLYRAWLSREADADVAVLRVIRRAFAEHRNPLSEKYDLAMRRVCDLSRKVSEEAERTRQFVRFSVHSSGLMVADIEPQYDVLHLVAGHFCGRYPSQPFMIRDLRRKKTLLWDTRERSVSDDPILLRPHLPPDREFAELWKQYFRAVAIPERVNPKRQQHFVPLKYRAHMTEMQ